MNKKMLNRAKLDQSSNVESSSSPRSNSFVQRLIATLERKQREFGSVDNIASLSNNKSHRGFRRDEPSGFTARRRHDEEASKLQERQDIGSVDRGSSKLLVQRRNSMTFRRFNSDPVDFRSRQLEDVSEEEQNSCDDYISSGSETDDAASNLWNSDASLATNDKNNNSKKLTLSRDAGAKTTSAAIVMRRTIKNMISAIKSWHVVPGLNKAKAAAAALPMTGSRDYYAARESLGEEMRAFRQNTMSKLMDDASGRLDTSRGERARREFSRIIGRQRLADDDVNCATIRPVYGTKNFGDDHNQFSTLRRKKMEEEGGAVQLRNEINEKPVDVGPSTNFAAGENAQRGDQQFANTLRRRNAEFEGVQLRNRINERPDAAVDVYMSHFINKNNNDYSTLGRQNDNAEFEGVQLRKKVYEKPLTYVYPATNFGNETNGRYQFFNLRGQNAELDGVQLRNRFNDQRSVTAAAVNPTKRSHQPPPAPIRNDSLSRPVSTSSIEQQPLLRPSKVRDIQKRLSAEVDLVANKARPASIVYDVPRASGVPMRRATVVADSAWKYLSNAAEHHDGYKYPSRGYGGAKIAVNLPPEYENVSSRIINNADDDRRLCTKFTSF